MFYHPEISQEDKKEKKRLSGDLERGQVPKRLSSRPGQLLDLIHFKPTLQS